MNKLGNIKHGKHGTTTYLRWRAMIQRCTSPSYHGYKHYGGKGISVHESWNRYEQFLADMGECPDKNMTLERINSELDYCPSNCKWATMAEQNRNRSCCRKITYQGRTMLLVDWAKEKGISANTIAMRIRAGWHIEKALNQPLRRRLK